MVNRKYICAIVGRRDLTKCKEPDKVKGKAALAGRMAAQLGYVVLTGGMEGVMQHAAMGAKMVGGLTIGLLPTENHAETTNQQLDIVLPTGMGIARNALTARMCDVMVALEGGTGTLEEMLFATDFKRPVVSWGSWFLNSGEGDDSTTPSVPLFDRVNGPEDARRWLTIQMERLEKLNGQSTTERTR